MSRPYPNLTSVGAKILTGVLQSGLEVTVRRAAIWAAPPCILNDAPSAEWLLAGSPTDYHFLRRIKTKLAEKWLSFSINICSSDDGKVEGHWYLDKSINHLDSICINEDKDVKLISSRTPNHHWSHNRPSNGLSCGCCANCLYVGKDWSSEGYDRTRIRSGFFRLNVVTFNRIVKGTIRSGRFTGSQNSGHFRLVHCLDWIDANIHQNCCRIRFPNHFQPHSFPNCSRNSPIHYKIIHLSFDPTINS